MYVCMYVYMFDLATRIRGFELKWECLCFYFLGIIERERCEFQLAQLVKSLTVE